MSRVSFEEFTKGLPVTRVNPKAPRVPEPRNQGNTFARVLKDAPSDIVETFKGVIGAGRNARDNFGEAFTTPGLTLPQRLAGAAAAPVSGAVDAAGEMLMGATKLFTTDEFEQQTNAALVEVGQKAMSSQAGLRARAFYDALPEDQKYMLTNVIAPVANTMTAGIGGITAGQVAKAGIRGLKSAAATVPSTVKTTLKRTPQEAAEAVVQAANPVVPAAPANPVMDTLRGAGSQIMDFGRRTAREAQETASESRRLTEMPAPKATLIKSGADERVVNVIDRSTPEERSIYSELVAQAKIAEQFPEDPKKLPKIIAGREYLKPVGFVLDKRKQVGAELGEARKALGTAKNIDTNQAFRNFHQYLKDQYQVQFDLDGKIMPDTGTLATGDIPQVQKLYDQLRGKEMNSEAELDQWLRRTLKDFDLVQQREKTFSEEVSKIAEVARGEVGELMPENYNALRTQYAQLSQPLGEMMKILGYKGDLDKLTLKELKAGEVALRMFGNAADRPQAAIDNMLETATANGYQSTVDINKLVYITDQLEDLYDITPNRGFSGSATRGINQSSAGVAADAATMNVGGLFDRAMSSRASQKEIQESFEAYLNSINDGTGTPGTFTPAQTIKDEATRIDQEVSAMIDMAPEAKDYIDGIADEVAAGIPDVRVAKAPIKSKDRAVEKVTMEEGGDATQLRDLARNSIVPLTPEARELAIAQMTNRTDLAKPPKFQTPENFSGYQGVIFNIKAPNGLTSEIQVVEPNMIFGKALPKDARAILGDELFDKIARETGIEPGYGHKLYEDMRSMSIEDLEGPAGQALRQESFDYYEKLR